VTGQLFDCHGEARKKPCPAAIPQNYNKNKNLTRF